MGNVKPHRFAGVFTVADGERRSLATRSMVSGQSVYGEKIIRSKDEEYRLWATRRSKLAAALQKDIKEMPIQPGSRVLYLGAASGTTVSHVSDIVGEKGVVYAVEFSVRIARNLLRLAQTRTNIVPIIDDARHPDRYEPLVTGSLDVVYQDVAQPDQARILSENMKRFCSYGAWGMIAIKARSVDSTAPVETIYNKEIEYLDRSGLELVEKVNLDPLEKDHAMIVCRVTEAVG